MSITPRKVIIIGSGPAGLTAAVYAARANLYPLLIEGDHPGGQLVGTTAVENWPGEKSIMGPKLMANIKEHAKHFGTEFMSGLIEKVDFSSKPFKLWTNKKEELHAHCVIIATGAIPNKLNCPGEKEYWGKGVTTCAVCDGAFYPDKRVMVVGGGDTAMEDASFLHKFTKKITVVQILDSLSASHPMQQRVLKNQNINVLYNSTVTEIKGDGSKITSVTVTNHKTQEKQDFELDGLFIAIGLKPNTKPFAGQIELDQYGYVKLHGTTETSIPGVFAAGDVFDYRYKQAITSAASGCKAALDAERYLKDIHLK